MSYQGDYGDGQPPQYPEGYGRRYPQDEPRQPQEYDPFARNQNLGGQQGTGGQQYPQQAPPWDGAQGSQRQPYGGQHPPQGEQYPRHAQSRELTEHSQRQPYGQPWPPQNQQYPPQVPPGLQPPFMPLQPQPKRKSWPARHKVLTGLMAVGALIVIIAAASASSKPSTPAADTGAASSSSSPSAAVSSAAASEAPSTPAAPASLSMTGAQQQAVDAARGYLSEGQGFSEQGLLGQLTSSAGNGFAKSDAEFAIHYLSPNWHQQAVDAARGYLSEGQGFSEQGLLQQLTSSAGSGFTQPQAEYAINYLHPDWDAQAVDAAKGYMQMGGFSQSSLIQQLTSSAGSGFTQAQAEYAASKVGL
jgi:Host cell surface-exposed lipoprotein